MKHIKHWLATIAVLLCSITVSAYNFKVDGIYYRITSSSELTVGVADAGRGKDTFSSAGYTNLVIPETVIYNNITYRVTSIEENAFALCSGLTYLFIPANITKFNSRSGGSSSLTSIVVDEDNVAYDSRGGCNAVVETNSNTLVLGSQTTIIPESVTSIGDYAFEYCNLTSITIPEGVTDIGKGAFEDCSLTSITIPEGVTSIGEYAFYGCNNLTSINIPESVTEIGDYAFIGCSSLTSIVLPKSLKSIESKAFADCENLTDVYCNAKSVPRTSRDAFDGSYPEYVTLHVPANALNAYKTTEPWSSFGKFETLETTILVEGITLSQTTATLTEGETMTLTATVEPEGATDQSVTWISSNEDVATVDGSGKVQAVASGNATITATANDGSGVSASCDVTVEKAVVKVTKITLSQTTATLTEGETMTFTATIAPEDATDKSITWSSSNTSVASVDNKGKVTAKASGNATITATANDGSGVSASCVVTVEKKVVAVSSITLSQSSATMIEGETLSLTATVKPANATNKGITWSSSNTSVATVDANGKVTAKAAGTATITATANDGSGAKASCKVTVEKKVILVSQIILSQTSAILTEGETLTLTATVTPDNADNTTISWSSSNEDIAMVSSKGKVVAMGVGTATITATANDGSGVKASCVVTVEKKVVAVSSITLSQSSATLIEGEMLNLTATVKPTDATNKGITWSSSNMSVATVDDNGKVTAVASGTTYITATANDGSGVSASCEVTVLASYTITYMVDGEVYHTETLIQGSDIVVPEEPTKEGYTFSGWSTLPETMPTHDVIVNGSFTINKYVVTFTVGGVVIVSDSLEYGAPITVPTMPAREGYTFSGWSDVAETVPASDVTYDACYVANIYKVYYFVGTAIVHIAEVAYGEAIPEYIYEPTAEGDVFMGWIGDTYDTMPAHDVVYTANIVNGIEQTMIDKGQFTIYDLSGRKVTDTENLKGGIYIVNGRKVVIK